MKKILIVLLALIPLLGFSQQAQIEYMKVIPNDPAVRTGTLESGIKYYIRHNAKDPQRANFHIVYNVGAIQEEDNQNGLAHFLEHMAFNGSKNFPGNSMIDYLQSIGVRFGENLNAGTGQEQTTYMVTNVPVTREGIVDSVILILHDWAGFINLDHKDIDEERGVILEELRGGQNASRRIRDKIAPALFFNSIYAKRNVIGTEELLKSFSYSDIESFYHKWYRPDMQAFVIVGDIDVDAVEAKLKTVMADIKPFDVQTPKATVVLENYDKPLVAVATDPEMTSTSVQVLFRHDPAPKEIKNLVIKEKMDVLTVLISDMINARLEEISKKGNAPFLSANAAYFNFIEPMDAFYLSASSKDGESLKALEAVYTEAIRMQKGGFVASELERAKIEQLSYNESSYKNRNDRRNGQFIDRYMDNFTSNTPFPDAEYDYQLTKQLVETTTLEEINRVALELVSEKNSSVIISAPSSSVVPTEAEVLASLEKLKDIKIEGYVDDVKSEPLVDKAKIKAGKVTKEEKGQFESTVWTLSNGVKVVIKPTEFKADEIQMTGTQKGGTSTISDLNDLTSIGFYSQFAGNAGLGNFNQSELTKALAGKLAGAYVYFGQLTNGISGNCTPKDLETMMQLAYLRMTAPRLEQSDLDVVKNQWSAMLPNIIKNPEYIFQTTAAKVFSDNDPRGIVSLPSMEMLDRVSIERMSKVYKQMFSNAHGMTFVFTGKIDLNELKPLVETYLGSLPSTKVTPNYGKFETKEVKGEVTEKFNTKMETPKVTALVVYSGKLDYTLTERLNLAAIRHILDVRYTKSIREEAGGTYGVHVGMQVAQNPRPEFSLTMSFNTDASKIDQLLPIVYKEIDDMMQNGVSEENLQIFKEFSVKKFAENNINNSVWRNYLSDYYVWGNDNYTDYVKAIEGVTLESVKATAKKALSQKNIVTLVQLPE